MIQARQLVFPGDRFECGHLDFRGTGDMYARLFLCEGEEKLLAGALVSSLIRLI